MGIEMEDVTGRPRPLADLERALRFVEAEIVCNPMRIGPKDTGPVLLHYMVIRDALRVVIAATKR